MTVEDELIDTSPLTGRKSPKKRSVVVKVDGIDPFSYSEISAIIDAATGRERQFIEFGFMTGMRISELIGLSWSKVDWINSTLRVDQVLTQQSDHFEEPKTQQSVRTIKLIPAAMEVLRKAKEFSYLKGQEIFQNPRSDERWRGDAQIRERMWKRVLKKAGVRYRYPYQMRHTCASTLLQAGESPYFVAAQMGHKDLTFTMRVYHRFIPDNDPNAGLKAQNLWEKNRVKTSLIQ